MSKLHWIMKVGKDRSRKKAQNPSGIEPMTSCSRGVCSTAVLQSHPGEWLVQLSELREFVGSMLVPLNFKDKNADSFLLVE